MAGLTDTLGMRHHVPLVSPGKPRGWPAFASNHPARVRLAGGCSGAPKSSAYIDVPERIRKLPDRQPLPGVGQGEAPATGASSLEGAVAPQQLAPGRVAVGNTPPPTPASAPSVRQQPVVAPLGLAADGSARSDP